MRLQKLPLQDISNIIENGVKLNRTCDACSDNTKIYGQKVWRAKAHATHIVKDIEYVMYRQGNRSVLWAAQEWK